MTTVIIENGRVIDPGSALDGNFDILIEDGHVMAIDKPGAFSALSDAEEIDASKKWVVPGLIDMHVHLREPGFEWKETIASGSQAAIAGGFTTVCCMANTKPVNDNAEITKYIIEQAERIGLARVLPFGAVSLGLEGKRLAELTDMAKAGCVAFSDDGQPVFDAGLMRRALEWCSMLGLRICCHQEDKALTAGGVMHESALSERLGLRGMPAVTEEIMIARDIELARAFGGRIHICHLSTARGVELVRRAKEDGIDVTAEVTPHHLFLTEASVINYDTNCKMSPPLRAVEDCDALWDGLSDGTIDVVASDHAPHELDSKQKEFSLASFGIIGLQTSLPLMLEAVRERRVSAERVIELFTSCPARVLDLELGTLRKGSVADVTVIDPEYRWSFSREVNRSKSFNTPFIDRKLQGCATTVLKGGIIKMFNGEFVDGRA